MMRWKGFRVRTLMMAVALVALLLWGSMMALRSAVFFRFAWVYGTNERQWREMAIRDRGDPARARTISAVWGLQFADYYGQLARKYRRAMYRPWATVPPDPLPPGSQDPVGSSNTPGL